MNFNPLELIYTGIFYMKSTLSLGGKKYIITFINNYIRYNYFNLIKGKDETRKTIRKYKIEVENQLKKDKKKIKGMESIRHHMFSLRLIPLNINTHLNLNICIKSQKSRSEYTSEYKMWSPNMNTYDYCLFLITECAYEIKHYINKML